jgi:RND family efflux transporter MFP subunit
VSEKRLKIVLPIAILIVGIAITMVMVKSRGPVQTRPPREYAPLVRVVTATASTHTFTVTTNGTVKPRTSTALVSEVAGKVVWVSPSFADGGFFEENDVLVKLDPRDYELAVVTARGVVAQARVRSETEEAQAEVAREEWKSLGQGKESPLATRELQLHEARAALASAEAMLEKAERDLERTRIRAPFAGRVREKVVDVGQFVSPGIAVATVFAVDYAEVRLPIPDSQLAYLDLPVDYRGNTETQTGPEVTLYADFAGRRRSWSGRIVRVEGEIDPVSRMIHAIAQVDDPYGRLGGEDRMPLAIGLFVDAEIMGRVAEDVIVVPRSAVRGDDTVLIVDDEDRLRFRKVDVLRVDRADAVISSGLNAGDRICVSLLDAATDGMKVRTTGSAEIPATETPDESVESGSEDVSKARDDA